MTKLSKYEQSQMIKAEALHLGFLDCGIAKIKSLDEEKAHLSTWLKDGLNAGMSYMENNFEKRLNPELLVENSKSIISVLLNYFPNENLEREGDLIISKYAYGKDYHFVIKEKLKSLMSFINQNITEVSGRAFADSAPVLDKAWAREAGLGWIGKNTCLISRQHGSFFFIGELILDIELDYDDPFTNDHCGSCNKCIAACPTGAITSPYRIDSKKCISYLTIESKEEIPCEFSDKFGNRIFGCDACQDVCPWNNKSIAHNSPELNHKPELAIMTFTDWQNLTQEKFNELFVDSPVTRTGYEGLMRNIRFCDPC